MKLDHFWKYKRCISVYVCTTVTRRTDLVCIERGGAPKGAEPFCENYHKTGAVADPEKSRDDCHVKKSGNL